MREVIIVAKFGKIWTYGSTLRAKRRDYSGKKREIVAPIKSVRALIVSGRLESTETSRRLMAANGVTYVSLKRWGTLYAYHIPPKRRENTAKAHAKMRCRERLRVARRIELDMIEAMERHLERLSIRDGGLSLIKASMELAEDIETLLGLEAEAWKIYYNALKGVFPEFPGRSDEFRRPPRDPINAQISVAYTSLYALVLTRILVYGLISELGFIHSRSPIALALDLAEPFKPMALDFVLNNHEKYETRKIKHGKSEGFYLLEDLSRFLHDRFTFIYTTKSRENDNRTWYNYIRSYVRMFAKNVVEDL